MTNTVFPTDLSPLASVDGSTVVLADNGDNGTATLSQIKSYALAGLSHSDMSDFNVSALAAAPAETAASIAALIAAASSKASPVDADVWALLDSAASGALKKSTWSDLKAALKTYFDALYAAAGSYITSGGALGTPSSGTLTNCGNLPISGVTGLQTQLDGKAPLASPALTGSPTAPNQVAGTNSTVIANTAYVDAAVSVLAAVVSGALVFKGSWDASSGTFPGGGTAQTGAFYKVTVAGTVDSVAFSVGDDIYAVTNNASTSTYSGNWLRIEGTLTLSEIQSAVGFTFGSLAALSSVTSTLISDASTIGKTVLTAANEGAIRTALSLSTTGSAIQKGNGSGGLASAVAGTDYQAPIGTISGLAKGNGANALTAAIAGTDYADNAFKTISVSGQSDVVADSASDTLTLAAGSNITITTNASTDTVTISSTGGSTGTDALAGLKNRIINGCMRLNQRSASSQTDDTYGFDRWNVLTQTGAVGVSAATGIANGWPYAMRLTQSQASAQRFGTNQIIESQNCVDLRGSTVVASARVQCSASTNVRIWLLEWTGTADSVTSDSINDWTSGTYTAGNFFISTTTTVVGTTTTALTANTPTTISFSGTISSSANNLIVGITTDSTQAQNVTLDIGKVALIVGSSALDFEIRPVGLETDLCKRYYERIYVQILGYGGAGSNGGIQMGFATKRSTPVFTNVSNNAVFSESNCGTSVSVQTGASVNGALFYRPITATAAFQFSEIWALESEL